MSSKEAGKLGHLSKILTKGHSKAESFHPTSPWSSNDKRISGFVFVTYLWSRDCVICKQWLTTNTRDELSHAPVSPEGTSYRVARATRPPGLTGEQYLICRTFR